MALIPCSECGKQVSTLATACPSCGAPPPKVGIPPPVPQKTALSPTPPPSTPPPLPPSQLAGGYWANVAGTFIRSQLIKPFLGRPHLRLGQCVPLWSSHFELGGMLAMKHGAKLDAFMPAFLGMSGEAGAAERFLVA